MKINYVEVSRSMLLIGEHTDISRRYIQLRKRGRILREGIPRAKRASHKHCLLRQIPFSAPISLAGLPSISIVRGEKLAMDGVPIAFDFDAKGRHRGTPLYDVMEALSVEFGREFGEIETLAQYRQYASASPRMLGSHPVKRYAKLPRLINRNVLSVRFLESQLAAATSTYSDRIFTATVSKEALEFRLACAGNQESVIIGYTAKGLFCIDGRPCKTIWGCGAGTAVVRTSDLRDICSQAAGPVGIECHLTHWRGWDNAAGSSGGIEFGYFRKD